MISDGMAILQAAAEAASAHAVVNLFSVAQAGAESTATWTAGGGTAAGAVQSTTKARTGTHSWAVTANNTAVNADSATRVTGLTAGVAYDFIAYGLSTAAARNFFVFVQWYNSGGGVVGSQSFSANVTSNTTTWTQSTLLTVTAPATATQVDVFMGFGTQNGTNLPASEVHYFDDLFMNVH